MIYYNENNKRFEYFSYKISYEREDQGVKTTINEYVNDSYAYAQMCSNNNIFSNFKSEVLKSTKEQDARLEELNKVEKKQQIISFLNKAQIFVEYGYVDKEAPEGLVELKDKYEELSKAYLVNRYAKLLSQYKTEKEQDKCIYNGLEISTDVESQSKITGILLSFQTGLISTINFKAKNGWLSLNKDEFNKLAQIVALHVQTCFNAEQQCLDEIKKKSVDELLELRTDYREAVKSNETINKLLEFFNGTYTTLYLATQSKLESIKEEIANAKTASTATSTKVSKSTKK